MKTYEKNDKTCIGADGVSYNFIWDIVVRIFPFASSASIHMDAFSRMGVWYLYDLDRVYNNRISSGSIRTIKCHLPGNLQKHVNRNILILCL